MVGKKLESFFSDAGSRWWCHILQGREGVQLSKWLQIRAVGCLKKAVDVD